MGRNLVSRKRGTLKKLIREVRREVATSVEASSDRIVDRQRSAVPVDTGTLRNTIDRTPVSQNGADISSTITAGGSQTTKRDANGGEYDYGVETEFGGIEQAAQPFFYASARAEEKETTASVAKAMKRAAKRAAR